MMLIIVSSILIDCNETVAVQFRKFPFDLIFNKSKGERFMASPLDVWCASVACPSTKQTPASAASTLARHILTITI